MSKVKIGVTLTIPKYYISLIEYTSMFSEIQINEDDSSNCYNITSYKIFDIAFPSTHKQIDIYNKDIIIYGFLMDTINIISNTIVGDIETRSKVKLIINKHMDNLIDNRIDNCINHYNIWNETIKTKEVDGITLSISIEEQVEDSADEKEKDNRGKPIGMCFSDSCDRSGRSMVIGDIVYIVNPVAIPYIGKGEIISYHENIGANSSILVLKGVDDHDPIDILISSNNENGLLFFDNEIDAAKAMNQIISDTKKQFIAAINYIYDNMHPDVLEEIDTIYNFNNKMIRTELEYSMQDKTMDISMDANIYSVNVIDECYHE